MEVNIDEKIKAIFLLAFLPKSYETLVTTLLVRKQTLTMDEVSTTFSEIDKIKETSSSSQAECLIVKEDNKVKIRRSRSELHETNSGQNDRSKSCPMKDVECYCCHKKRHVRRFSNESKKDLETRKNQKPT